MEEFQSTHPWRGAPLHLLTVHILRKISIHAPLAGCDVPPYITVRIPAISIHAPLAGCDIRTTECDIPMQISIHAPLAGCDDTGKRIPLF